MIVLIDKTGRNTKVFPVEKKSEAQKLVDAGDWIVETDKTGAMTKASTKKTTKKTTKK